MRSELDTPVSERYLTVQGRAGESLHAGLPVSFPRTARRAFVSYSYADLPIGKQFDCCYPENMPSRVIPVPIRLLGVTQQFGKPFDQIPHGWKTICLFDFPEGVPPEVDALPILEGWDFTARLIVCDRRNLPEIQASRGSPSGKSPTPRTDP